MASPPAAVTLSAAAPAGGNGKSVCRAARPRACAACSALRPATRATGAAFSMVCVAHVQSGFANCNAATWFSQQQWSGRWPDFLQKPPRLAPASARFLPLTIRFPWVIPLHFCQASSLASTWSCSLLLLLGRPRARLHGLGMPGALSNPRAQRAVLRRAAPAVARAPRACRRLCRASIYLPPPPRRTDPIAAVILGGRNCACAPAIPALACHAPDGYVRDYQPRAERDRPAIEPQSYGPRARPSLRARAWL